MKIDRTTGAPAAYRQVAADLRGKIADGTYPPGSQLPPGRDLAKAYKVSRIVIDQAFALLRTEGTISTEQGRGTFVREVGRLIRASRSRLSAEARAQNKAGFLGDVEAAGMTPSVTTSVRVEPASADHATALGIRKGAKVLVRDRVHSADGEPVQLAVSRLPRSLTRGTRIEDDNTGEGGIHARLIEAGITLHRHVESVRTRMPTTDETSALQLAPGVPVFAVRRITYDTTGRAVEINDITVAGDRVEFTYEIPAD